MLFRKELFTSRLGSTEYDYSRKLGKYGKMFHVITFHTFLPQELKTIRTKVSTYEKIPCLLQENMSTSVLSHV